RVARAPRASPSDAAGGAGGALEARGQPHRPRRLHLRPGAARLRAGHRGLAVLFLPRARRPALVDRPGECGRGFRSLLPDLRPRAPRPIAGGAVELISGLLYGFAVSFTPANLFACFVGVFVGTLIGVLPGIGPVATMSLLLPVTYALSPTASIIMMAGVYYGAMYGGSTTSILVNIPGEAASVVTCLDGYQMARQGRARPALGIAAIGSFIAGTLSVLGIMLLAPPLTRVALRFGPPEIFALLLLGFTMVTYLTAGSKLKAVAMALLGMLLGTIGLDPISASPPFTDASLPLVDGLGLVPIIMGRFGSSEVLLNTEKGIEQEVFDTRIKGLFPTREDWKRSASPIARGSVLGFVLGILPGVGAIIPTFIS